MEKIKHTLKYIKNISIIGTILFSTLMVLKLIAVSILPFDFFVDIEYYYYDDRTTPATDIIFVNKRDVISDMEARAFREIYRTDVGEGLFQHPGAVITQFTYDSAANGKDITIPINIPNPITQPGEYRVVEFITIEIPVWFLTVEKSQTLEDGKFTVHE